jgi:hypothetical protein
MNAFHTVPNDRGEKYRALKAAVAAVDAMHRARPLRPPPLPRTVYEPSAARLALAREIRRGTYVPGGRFAL